MSKQSTDKMLDDLQRMSFSYFLHEANASNGLVADKTRRDWPASIAATGMALSAYPVGVERGFMSRADAVARTLATLRFFHGNRQDTDPQSTGYKGFYYHFLNMKDGARAWNSELSTVDSAFLIAGALLAGAYFDGGDEREQEIRWLTDELYCRVDWDWARDGGRPLCHGWNPESSFLKYWWTGYNEALLLYMLALGSPTHAIPEDSYKAWLETYSWKEIYGIEYLYAGPLFIHQLSHIWIDFRGIADEFMREKGIDYFENSRRATRVQQEYAKRNPLGYKSYGELCWGVTASDGPGPATYLRDGVEREFFDYRARGVPYGPDDGTLAPWAVVASLPFAPEIVLPTIANFVRLKLQRRDKYGFKATFNPTFLGNDPAEQGWVSPFHFGINQGPIVLMIENYRSGLIWELMKKCRYIANGLRRAGFSGGWLDAQADQANQST